MNPAARSHLSPSPQPTTDHPSFLKDHHSTHQNFPNRDFKRNADSHASPLRSTPRSDHSNGDEDQTDSEAETVVLERNDKSDIEQPIRNGRKFARNGRKANGHDHDDVYSSDLSSAPSSPVPRPPKSIPPKSLHRRTFSSTNISNKDERYDADGHELRLNKKRKGLTAASRKSSSKSINSPENRIRVKSSSPIPPSHLKANRLVNGHRLGHTRTRSAQVLPSPRHAHLKIRKGHERTFQSDDASGDESPYPSRSNSPDTIIRLQRRSPGHAASPARISQSHKSRRDNTGRTQFFKKCDKGNLTEAKRLLELDPGLKDEADNGGYLPIHAAALSGRVEVVRFLIDVGSPIDQPALDLSTPLFDAVDNRHISVVQLLLEAGADPRKRNKTGQTVLDAAAENKKQAKEESDLEAIDEIDRIEGHLQTAVQKLRSKRISEEDNPYMESSSSRGVSVASPVHLSPPPTSNHSNSKRRTGRSEPTRQDLLWLDSGKGGMQKLRDSSKNGDIEMVGKLLESGNIPDDESVILAAKGGHGDVLSLLLAFGGDGDPDPKEVVKRAREKGLPINTGEETPILATIGRGGNLKILELLLRTEGMNPRRLDSKGRSYVDICRDRAGDNMEEELKLLRKAWDDASEKHKKASKVRDRSPSKKKNREHAEDKVKREHRRSFSEAVSSMNGDNITASDKESVTAKKPKHSKLEEMERKERVNKAFDSDNSATSDANAGVKKKRRLVQGKDLKDEETKPRTNPAKPHTPKINPDVEMSDLLPPPQKRHVEDAPRKIKKENSQHLQVSAKRIRDDSASSTNRTNYHDKSSDTEASITAKKRRKLEALDRKDSNVKIKPLTKTGSEEPPIKKKKRSLETPDDDERGRKRSREPDKLDKVERSDKEKKKEHMVKKGKLVKETREIKKERSETPSEKERFDKERFDHDKDKRARDTKHEKPRAIEPIDDKPAKLSKSPSYIPPDEKERVNVLMREQRSSQDKGLLAGIKQRAEFLKLKAEKDRERVALELAEKAEEEERLEEERKKQQLRQQERAERVRAEAIAKERQQAEDEARIQRERAEFQRIQSLPFVYRDAATTTDKGLHESQTLQSYQRFLPIFVLEDDSSNWISNAQAVLLLGTPAKLDMLHDTITHRKLVTSAQQSVLRNVLQDMYCPDVSSVDISFDMNEAWVTRDAEGTKFENMERGTLFWIKFNEFMKIIENDGAKYAHLLASDIERSLVKISTSKVEVEKIKEDNKHEQCAW